ncbi:TetR/AcrR family transcriptional regulator [Bacillus sp. FJAT-42376]|uniref:TetR/AcrR family transcriptional regulator n=1 Tax=Bacillus sp. FJAT-42376 TaxID=2014076 RepID=UPI000F5005FA|nr:TetR/AcrR family transcriptional regulator [Bacillus sp. FJAT-42376]AZB41001.1 TetR/AcrR family transcriptional regulator [Bacillus sp. FJAT-42376]
MRKLDDEQREEMRTSYAKKLMNVMRIQGFSKMKIQDMTQLINVSKATLYNYFSSKEEIIQKVGEVFTDYSKEVDETLLNKEISYTYRFQKVFQQAALSAIYSSEIFMRDLRQSCPDVYQEITAGRKWRENHIKDFYEEGIREGVFHPVNPSLLIMQDEAAFKRLLSPAFLMEEGISVKRALYDYYEIKKLQLLKPEVLDAIDDRPMGDLIDYILKKMQA